MRLAFITNPCDAESHVVLQELLRAGHDVAALVTARERRRGKGPWVALLRVRESRGAFGAIGQIAGLMQRKLRVRMRAVLRSLPLPVACAEELVLQRNIPLLRPQRLEEPWLAQSIRELSCELIAVCFCTQKLPAELLRAAKQGAVNMHRSLLPAYAGPRPVFWALYHGEKETGVTVHRMVEEIDAGEILAQEKVVINDNDTEASLGRKLLIAGACLMKETLAALEKRVPLPAIRSETKPSYFSRPLRGQVAELHNRLRRRRAGTPGSGARCPPRCE